MSRTSQPGPVRHRSLAPALIGAQTGGVRPGELSLNARGPQGEVRFFLQRFSGGLYVEREDIPRRGLHTSQSIFFSDVESFTGWCDDDAIRFEHPLLHLELKRAADDLLRTDASPTAS